MDYATAQLLLELQLQDLQDLEQELHVADIASSDDMHAFSLYKNELQRAITSLSDQRLCQTLFQTVGEDIQPVCPPAAILNLRDTGSSHQLIGENLHEQEESHVRVAAASLSEAENGSEVGSKVEAEVRANDRVDGVSSEVSQEVDDKALEHEGTLNGDFEGKSLCWLIMPPN